MKKTIFYFMTLLLLPKMHATVIWQGTNVVDVINENILITSNCKLTNNITEIHATECDVTVEITKDALIEAQQNAQYIYVEAVWPYSVTFKVHHDLEFRGVENQPTEDLQIYVYGNGAIRWEIDEDSKLKFNSTSSSGGVKLWISYDNNFPIHIFKVSRQHQITFGKRCSIGYSIEGNCGTTALETFIEADDANTDMPYIIMDETSQFAVKLIAVG
ncbi:hypothetical protein EKK58_03685 [Candidatus Dependentiae bacterium]|nr:MAG: hypothetical protein EKK58_03685 [Candidatus Dependentiae bacterium]